VYKSVQHRVVANSYKEERISVVMFFNPSKTNDDCCYGPLPELLSPEKPAIYRNFTLKEFEENFYSKGLDSKSMIEKVKIQN
jgi:isopenicillin N synthase-like dioxygenase